MKERAPAKPNVPASQSIRDGCAFSAGWGVVALLAVGFTFGTIVGRKIAAPPSNDTINVVVTFPDNKDSALVVKDTPRATDTVKLRYH